MSMLSWLKFDGYEVCEGTRGYDRMDFVLVA